MAGCHLRSHLFLQSRLLATKTCHGRWFLEHSRSFFNISSLSKDYRHCGVVSNRRENTPLLTNISHFEETQLRYLHFSRTVLYPDKETDSKKDTGEKTDKVDSGNTTKSDQGVNSQAENVPEEKLSVFQRFKKTYKEHGKVLVGVHLVTSAVWFGSFFYAAKVGVDVIPAMEWLGLPDKVINPFRNSSLGDIALAYLMYKLATPARYTVTLAGTNYAIKYLRKVGKMQPKNKNASFRVLAKDSRTELRKRRGEVQKKTKNLETRLKERRIKVKDRYKKFRSKLKDRRLKSQAARKSRRSPRSKR
ncbi:uncharacterized protein C18orf19 homolog A-like [Mercenaria mercenaria]|uniref:uncharacterized protein C18orf19 homolog A-like n=1 Tax=Mercenaria mercenaria TaxID=6596 RepID=UPI00234F175B|nr:uncharacterized protein C18orf19 homolog A-like [Mercenaria mercenaria]